MFQSEAVNSLFSEDQSSQEEEKIAFLFIKSEIWMSERCPSVSDPPDHELRGPAGRPGVRPGQGALPGTQPGNPLRLHRRHRGEAARWLAAVLAVPRSLRQDGRPPLQRESGKKIGKEAIPDWQPLRSFRVEALQPGSCR